MTRDELARVAKTIGAHSHALYEDGTFMISFRNQDDLENDERKRMIREGLRIFLPFMVELNLFEQLEDYERESLNEALAPESILSMNESSSTYTFCALPLWDRQESCLYFRSEADFILASMLFDRRKIKRCVGLGSPDSP